VINQIVKNFVSSLFHHKVSPANKTKSMETTAYPSKNALLKEIFFVGKPIQVVRSGQRS